MLTLTKRHKRAALSVLAAVMLFIAFAGIASAPIVSAAVSTDSEQDAANQTTPDAGPAVYVIPLKGEVEPSMYAFLKRAFKEAREAKAERIILVVNTYGGRIDSADDIGELLRDENIPITAFVEGKAVSAGTYIILNADQIAMQSGSSIGSAAVVDGSGELVDNPKTVSFWVGQMSEAARLHDRDPSIAAAMSDVNAEVDLTEEIGRSKKAGDILSLTASEALKVGYSEYTADSLEDVVTWLQLDGREQIEVKPSAAENVAKFLTNGIVATILLILGIAGIAIELIVPGFGAPGLTGLICFGLFFFGSYISGLAGIETIILFVVGIVLLIIELFVPSFGILGLLGGAALIASVVMSAPDPMTGFLTIVIAFAVATVIVIIVARTNRGRGVWNKFILKDKLTSEEGYLSSEVKTTLVGAVGVSITPLRPAGTALIAEERMDVVTSGEFIAADRPVKIIKAEGTWIVVKEVTEEG
ncbi:nodulation protein NfeD [Paenibacillus sp. HB172176]|uniref:NfeD family protein n=1 Tax=Paenibacillus sp. HB172176 TaxID=2493690 RepID=UPI001F0FAEFB|nr:nodulation protein NfeD [Paenibacillus sp. HB172176]